MKLIVTKDNLVTALKKATCAISPRVVLPIMANVLLHAEGDRLTITASDNEITIITWVPALIEEEGETTLAAKKFQQIISALPNGDITLDANEEDTTKITCKNSNFKIHGLSSIDFPKSQDIAYDSSFQMKVRELTRGMTKVVYARSDDEQRKQLNGVVMSLKNGMMTLAATDGRRLAMVENPIEDENLKDGDFILPSRASSDLGKCIDESGENVTIRLSKSCVSFETLNTILITKLIEGTYPNFRQVIPENCGFNVSVQRPLLMEVLSRVSLIVNDNGGSIKLTFLDNKLTVSASNQETGESTEYIDVAYEGEEIGISFNPSYFLEPLKVMEADCVNIEFGKNYSPVKLLGDDNFLYMVMPMRG